MPQIDQKRHLPGPRMSLSLQLQNAHDRHAKWALVERLARLYLRLTLTGETDRRRLPGPLIMSEQMAHLTLARPGAFAPVAVLSRAVATIREWNSRRQTLATLHKLSDHELDDIGIPRHALEDYVNR